MEIMKAAFTLDYELFLGERTGTVENCIVRPMKELCRVSEKYGFHYVVFVDAAYLLMLSKLKSAHLSLQNDYDMICNNLRALVAAGHDIQLHFHPQWLYSARKENEWVLDKTHYKLSDMPEEDRVSLFKEAKACLDSIIGYNTTAFRAGGYCVQPFNDLYSLFMDNGIRVDSSVARDLYVKSPIHSFDYRKHPVDQIYSFKEDVVTKDNSGPFSEMSISSCSYNPLYFLFFLRRLRNLNPPRIVYGDGIGITDGINLWKDRFKRLFEQKTVIASIDGADSVFMESVYNKIKKMGQKEIIFIGHPKFVTDSSISNIEFFLERHKNLSFFTSKDIYNAQDKVGK